MNSSFRPRFVACLLVGMWLVPVSAWASSVRSTGKLGENRAPNMEDHANYFSTEEATANWQKRAQADAMRLKAIRSIQRMVKENIPAVRKFELYLRLGELYAERSDYIRAVEINDWERRYKIWAYKKKGTEPKLSHKNSEAELLKSAAAFRKLVRTYPRHSRADAALYSLAKTLARMKSKQAVTYFDKLIRDYPKSRLIPDAYLALGEYYFDKNNMSMAMRNYKAAVRYKNSPAYPYAVYKLGWSYYNSEDGTGAGYRKALSAFKLVVRLSEKEKNKRRLNLKKEAISDLVMVWAETEGVSDAWNYFSRLKEYEAFYDVLEKLGNTYAEQGKNQKAIAAYTRLLKEAPHRERNPTLYSKLVELHDQTGQRGAVINDLIAMHQLYANQSVWTKKNIADKELVAEAKEKVEFLMHRYGTLYHKRGQKTNRDYDLKAAMKIYQVYLQHYPKEKNAYDIRFYLADIYFHFKMFEPSSDEYLRVALQSKKGPHFQEAATNSVVAINTLVAERKWPKLPELGEAKKEYVIPREKQKLVKVIDTFVKLLPNDKLAHPMKFTAAKVFFEHGHYPEALTRFELLALRDSETKEGKIALKTILGFHTKRQEWPIVVQKAKKYLAAKVIKDRKQLELIVDHMKNGIYKQGLLYAKLNKHENAAKMFLIYQKDFPNDKDADKALYNASLNYYKMAAVDRALKTDQALLKAYPKSSLVPDVNLSISQTYEAIAEYGQAAKYYAMFARNHSNDKRAPASLYNAATLFRGMKQYELALANYQQFISRYPSHPSVPDALFETGGIYETLKRYPEAVSSFKAYLARANGITQDRRLFVRAKAARIEYERVDRSQGKFEIESLAKELQSKGSTPAYEARRLVAEVLFNELNRELSSFYQAKLRSAKTLESDVKSKQAQLLRIAGQYENIIAIGSGEYVVASLYRLGEMHERFAHDLFSAPNPIGANQVTIDAYKSSIEKVAFPLKEEAYKYYETAFKRASEVETFTAWTKRAYMKMAELYPEKHPEILEQASKPVYLSHNLLWDNAVTDLVD